VGYVGRKESQAVSTTVFLLSGLSSSFEIEGMISCLLERSKGAGERLGRRALGLGVL